jgi:small GTP-binding protein
MGCSPSSQSENRFENHEAANSTTSLLLRHGLPLVIKVLLVGASGCGKTALIQRYMNTLHAIDKLKPTIGFDFFTKRVTVGRYQTDLQIWDTAGQEPTNSLSNAFFRRADVVVLVFDVTEWRTFEAVTEIYESYHQNFDEMNKTIYILVGNKIDRNENRTVTERDAQLWTSTRGCIPCYFTSAKTGEGVNDLFFNVARLAIYNVDHDNAISDRLFESYSTPSRKAWHQVF